MSTNQPPSPEDSPPAEVMQPLMWHMAVQLLADHRAHWAVPPWQTGPTCHSCSRPWPCEGRKLGERGLLAAMRQPELRPPQPRQPGFDPPESQ